MRIILIMIFFTIVTVEAIEAKSTTQRYDKKKRRPYIQRQQMEEDKKFYVYAAINMGREFDEIGEADNNAAGYMKVHFERPGFGVGFDYKLEQKFIKDFLEWRAGFYYELQRTSLQISSTAGATRESELELQAKIISLTALMPRNFYDIMLGINYTIMDSDGTENLEDHRVKNDYGFHAGIGVEKNKWRLQLLYRYLTNETKDKNGYEGQINLSSFLITLGQYF